MSATQVTYTKEGNVCYPYNFQLGLQYVDRIEATWILSLGSLYQHASARVLYIPNSTSMYCNDLSLGTTPIQCKQFLLPGVHDCVTHRTQRKSILKCQATKVSDQQSAAKHNTATVNMQRNAPIQVHALTLTCKEHKRPQNLEHVITKSHTHFDQLCLDPNF